MQTHLPRRDVTVRQVNDTRNAGDAFERLLKRLVLPAVVEISLEPSHGVRLERVPDETTILNFRHLLERHGLTEAIFADVNAHLADKGITLRSGTLVDATIIDAPSSTKNKAGARDPEMTSTKKGNTWYVERLAIRTPLLG